MPDKKKSPKWKFLVYTFSCVVTTWQLLSNSEVEEEKDINNLKLCQTDKVIFIVVTISSEDPSNKTHKNKKI